MISRKEKRLSVLFFVLAAAWMAVIFFLSAQDAGESGETSGRVVGMIVRIFRLDAEKLAGIGGTEALDSWIRRLAHFTEYALLGLLLVPAWRFSGLRFAGAMAWGIASLWAVLDEVHQAFVPGRACQWQDMLTDSVGAALGTAVMLLILFAVGRRKNNASESHVQTE